MFRLIIVFALGLLATPSFAETQIRLVSWNISNFTHVPGIELRPTIGTLREADDFEALKRYAEALDADIIALQEIGTVEAAEMLFPSPEFTVYPSEHLEMGGRAQNEGEIYTAIAVRNRPEIVVVEQADLNDLAVIHEADGRPVRSGTALRVTVNATELWVVSVHLKSSCPAVKAISQSTNDNCETFWKQRVPLQAWIGEREASSEMFAIMGDFNRQFRRFGSEDEFWMALSADGQSQPNLVAHPTSVTRLCPTRLGLGTQPIDWILLSDELATSFVSGSYWETRYTNADVISHGGRGHGTRLSDHCPIQLDLAL